MKAYQLDGHGTTSWAREREHTHTHKSADQLVYLKYNNKGQARTQKKAHIATEHTKIIQDPDVKMKAFRIVNGL